MHPLTQTHPHPKLIQRTSTVLLTQLLTGKGCECVTLNPLAIAAGKVSAGVEVWKWVQIWGTGKEKKWGRDKEKSSRGMSATKQKHAVNVLERDVIKIKIVISEALVQHTHKWACWHSQTCMCAQKWPHTDREDGCVFYGPHLVWLLLAEPSQQFGPVWIHISRNDQINKDLIDPEERESGKWRLEGHKRGEDV